MKSFIVLALFVAAAVAAPAPGGSEADATIIRNDLDNIGVEGFQHAAETSNGIKQEAQGQVKNVGTENEALVIRGQFSYPGPDGVQYTIVYVADENGYQPQGAHIPQPLQ